MKKITLLLIGLSLLTACSESPLDKLKSDKADHAILPFWEKEAKAKSSLWNEAVSYCEQNQDKPNCGAIKSIQFDESMLKSMTPKKVPAYGSNPDECF